MKKIAVIGSINMDLTAAAARIPRPGETVSAQSLRYVPGGKGANQAVAAARLGGDVTMFGCVGDDGFGPELIANLRANGVNADHVGTVPGESSGIAMIVVAENDNAITVIPGANGHVTPAYVERNWAEIAKADIVLLQNEIPPETVRYAALRLRAAGKTVICNPAPAAPADAELLAAVTYLTPNEHEARIVLGDAETPVETLIERFGGKLIVTLGARGVGCCGSGGAFLRIPAIRAKVVDTTGAGDTMNGAFAFALAEGMDCAEALRFSNAAAGLATEKSGAQAGMPTRAEVERRL
jgi:ribokinase